MKSLNKTVVFIDKPRGLTSHQTVQEVKKILKIARAGHSGTIDKNFTGILLIALNEARKAMPVLMGLPKEYAGMMILHGDIPEEKIKKVFRKFTGKILQTPPVKSRVVRKPRIKEIYELEVLGVSGRKVTFRVRSEAGLYIRKLVHDIGEKLSGAHLNELRRTGVGPFDLENAVSLENLKTKNIVPLEKVLEKIGLKKIIVKPEAIAKIKNGMALKREWIVESDEIKTRERVGFFDLRKNIIALGVYNPRGDVLAKTDRVFKY
jgi:H/ACA ribonucleoprotein complex subunit 4